MPIVRFKGRVLPEVVQISFTDIPRGNWRWDEENLTMQFTLHIAESQIDIECEIERYEDSFLVELHRRAFDLARACINVAAFASGFGVSVVFTEFIRPDGTPTAFFFHDPRLPAECTAYKMPAVSQDEKQIMEKILMMVMSDPALFMALNDLIQANSVPHLGPTNCGRVLDGLRKLVTPGMEPKAAWPVFRNALQVDEAFITFISEHSKNPRHGEHVRIDGPTAMEITRRTWAIMNRFLEYRKRGNQQLPLSSFPLLKG